MFMPTPMRHVDLLVLTEDAPKAALALAQCKAFSPETTPARVDALPEFPGERYRHLYQSARGRLDRILAFHAFVAQDPSVEPLRETREDDLAGIDDWLRTVGSECAQDQERLRRTEREREHIDQLIETLDRFSALDMDLGRLQRRGSFLDVRIGTVPEANARRLAESVALAGFVATTYLSRNGTAHVVLAGLAGQAGEITTALQAAGWRDMEIPREFTDHPAKVRQGLISRRQRVMAEGDRALQSIEESGRGLRERLGTATRALAVAAPFVDLRTAVRGRGELALISGWVPRRDLPDVTRVLGEHLGGRVVSSARDPLPEERMRVPSAMTGYWPLMPFASLVKTYGVPRYGEIDPTVPFAITFVVMYGAMFGDAGQGAVIALGALALRRRLKPFAPFAIAAGLSSVVFGFLYGSVFGYTGFIQPLWMSPLSDPMRMLLLALGWGAGFMVLATVLNIRNRFAERNYREALFGAQGVAGLVFYVGLLYGGYRYASGAALGMRGLLAILGPLGVILAYLAMNNPARLGERIVIVAMEGFETIVQYLSNTLSFLRIAAFSLNHVALAIAVFTISGMLHTAGRWTTVVLGNLFIIVFEGAIVAIQALRLEYYEGFSRFFRADGREFHPLELPRWMAAESAAERN